MKLELKYLAPYLPYGLKVQTNKGLLELTTIKNGEPEYPFWCESFGDYDNEDYNYSRLKGYRGRGFAGDNIQPVLRPLSDLTKEIAGVVHFEIIKEAFPNVPNFYSLLRTKVLDNYPLSDTNVEYCIVDYLIQHHFDVFGLIEKGLAIDINTINL